MGDDVATSRKQVEDPLVIDTVKDRGAVATRLDQADPPQRREMPRRAAGVKVQVCLQHPHRAFAVTQQLKNPHPRRMTQHPKQRCLHLMHSAGVVRHLATILHIFEDMKYCSPLTPARLSLGTIGAIFTTPRKPVTCGNVVSGWRWRWDLNPRRAFTLTRFRGVRARPLRDSTAGEPS